MSRLIGRGNVATPPQAQALYRRDRAIAAVDTPCEMVWAPGWMETLLKAFTAVLGVFVWTADPPGRDRWGVWSKIWRRTGQRWRLMLHGDCDDFAVELLRRLLRAGFPRGALRLATCRLGKTPHLVLTIETDRGTLVACNVARLCWLGSPRLNEHRFLAREKPGGWEAVTDVTLEDLIRAKQES